MESLKAAKSDERWKDACEDGSESSDECGDDGGEDCDKFEWLILICVRGFGRTDERTDIGDCRVSFATEKYKNLTYSFFYCVV